MLNRKHTGRSGAPVIRGHFRGGLAASALIVFLALLTLATVGGQRAQAAEKPLPQAASPQVASPQAGSSQAAVPQAALPQATLPQAAQAPGPSAAATDLPFELEADVIDYDPAAQILTAQGAVTLIRGGVMLHADRVEISFALNSLSATGHLALSWQGREVRGEELYLDMTAWKGHLRNASGTVSGITFAGENLSFDGDSITVESGYLSTCNLDMPHYRLTGTRIIVYPGSRAAVEGGWLRIGNVPVLPVLGTDIRLDSGDVRFPVPRLYLNRETGLGAAVDISYYLGAGSWADLTLGYASKKGIEGGLGVSTQLRDGTAVSARADYTLDDQVKASLDVSRTAGFGVGLRGRASYSTAAGAYLGIEAAKGIALGEVLGLSGGRSGLIFTATAQAAYLADAAPSGARAGSSPAGGVPGVEQPAGAAMGQPSRPETISGGKVQVGGTLSTGRVAVGRSGHLQGTAGLASAWYSAGGGALETRTVLTASAQADVRLAEGLASSVGYSVRRVFGATPFAYDYVGPSESLWGEVRIGVGDFSFAAKGTYDILERRHTGTTYEIAYRMHCLEALVAVDPARGHIGFDLRLPGF